MVREAGEEQIGKDAQGLGSRPGGGREPRLCPVDKGAACKDEIWFSGILLRS